VGGIAGSGAIVTDCRSMVQITGGSEKAGAVLGIAAEPYAEEENPRSGNLYVAVGADRGGIDGISYLTDERMRRGDNRTSQLTNISEDLMDLSIELKVPIIVVAQYNREGAKDDEAPGLENIRDSDGIAYNCSVAISARQKDSKMELNVRKNRNGVTGDKLSYLWDIDTGNFTFVENEDDDSHSSSTAKSDEAETPPWSAQSAPEYRDGTEVF
jgi:hypothetical protein